MIIENGISKDLKKYMQQKFTIAIVHADWCGSCQMMKAELDKLANERKDLDLVKLNVEENQDFVIEKRIEGTPTIFIYKDGVQINAFYGFRPKEVVEELLK